MRKDDQLPVTHDIADHFADESTFGPLAHASLLCVIPTPSMKSPVRTSPRWIGLIRSSAVMPTRIGRSASSELDVEAEFDHIP